MATAESLPPRLQFLKNLGPNQILCAIAGPKTPQDKLLTKIGGEQLYQSLRSYNEQQKLNAWKRKLILTDELTSDEKDALLALGLLNTLATNSVLHAFVSDRTGAPDTRRIKSLLTIAADNAKVVDRLRDVKTDEEIVAALGLGVAAAAKKALLPIELRAMEEIDWEQLPLAEAEEPHDKTDLNWYRRNEAKSYLDQTKIRDSQNQEINWSDTLGTEANYQKALVYLRETFELTQASDLVQERAKGFDVLEKYEDKTRNILIEKRQYKGLHEDFTAYYYQVPEYLLKRLVENHGSTISINRAEIEADEKQAKEFYNHEYGCEIPTIGIIVRSSEKKSKLEENFGPVMDQWGWTSDGIPLAMLKNPQNPESHSIAEMLLRLEGSGHEAVFIIPQLHFKGAIDLNYGRERNGRIKWFETGDFMAEGNCTGIKALVDKYFTDLGMRPTTTQKTQLVMRLLSSSGLATQFVNDLQEKFGIHCGGGHSRGGEVASNNNALNNFRRIADDTFALMRASNLPGDAQEIRNSMQLRFKALGIVTWFASPPKVGNYEWYRAIAGKITPGIIEFLLKDDILSLPQNKWLLKYLVDLHKQVIAGEASPRAVSRIIDILGQNERRPLDLIFGAQVPAPKWTFLPEMIAPNDQLSLLESLQNFRAFQNGILKENLSRWIPLGYADQFMDEMMQKTVMIAQLRTIGVNGKSQILNGGHYACEVEELAERFFSQYWFPYLRMVRPKPKDQTIYQALSGDKYLPLFVPFEVKDQLRKVLVQKKAKISASAIPLVVMDWGQFERRRRVMVAATKDIDALDKESQQCLDLVVEKINLEQEMPIAVGVLAKQRIDNWWQISNGESQHKALLDIYKNFEQTDSFKGLDDKTKGKFLVLINMYLIKDRIKEAIGKEYAWWGKYILSLPENIKYLKANDHQAASQAINTLFNKIDYPDLLDRHNVRSLFNQPILAIQQVDQIDYQIRAIFYNAVRSGQGLPTLSATDNIWMMQYAYNRKIVGHLVNQAARIIIDRSLGKPLDQAVQTTPFDDNMIWQEIEENLHQIDANVTDWTGFRQILVEQYRNLLENLVGQIQIVSY